MTTWRAIPGWEGYYEVSDTGSVRGVDRVVGVGDAARRQRGKVLTAELRVKWGHRLSVRLARHGNRRNAGVGHLVLTAFVGPCPDGMECCHNNGDATDNRVSNLRWDTHSANMFDQVAHGTHVGAAKTHCIRGHPLLPDRPKQRQCPTCRREDYERRKAAAA